MNGWQSDWDNARQLEVEHDWPAAVAAYVHLLRLEREEDDPELLFRVGHAYFHLGELTKALEFLLRATRLRPDMAAWHYRLGYVFEKRRQMAEAVEHFAAALAIEPDHPRWLHRLEVSSAALERAAITEKVAREAEVAVHRERVADVVNRKAPKWQEIDALEAGLHLHREDAAWRLQLADAQFYMDRFDQAAENYQAATALKAEDAEWHFKEGWAWERAGQPHLAQRAFRRAIAEDRKLDSASFGIGVFFQRKGQWALAATAYRATLESNPGHAELHYKLGFALQRCYDWAGSERVFRVALTLSPEMAQWHYRRGFSFERLERWQDAADSYAYAVHIADTGTSYWYFRLGFVLTQLENYEAACTAFASTRKSEPLPLAPGSDSDYSPNGYVEELFTGSVELVRATQSPQLCFELGARAEAYGLTDVAAEAYAASVKRTEIHSSDRYYRLGRVLALRGDYKSACSAYLETRLFKQAHGIDTSAYLKDKHKKNSMVYVEYMESLEIQEDVILYESGQGASVSCNPRQICKLLLADPRFDAFTHVWVLNNKDRVPAEFKGRDNIIFFSRDSDLYLRYLASAKYLINNNTFPPYFSRRVEQEYLNTWHGTPIKTLGRDIKNGVMDHRNAARNFLHATHLIAPNHFTADCLIRKYDVEGIFSGKLAVTGYPRVDATVATPSEMRAGLKSRLGIAPGAQVVFYAPTWRGSLSDRTIDVERLLDDVTKMAEVECHFLFRGHSMTEDQLSTATIDAHVVPAWVDTNELLSIVDVLITDYSSIFFDFMATGRPILYYAYDLEEYSEDRGLYFDLEDMPGSLCRDLPSLLTTLKDVLRGDERALRANNDAVEKFSALETGKSAHRVVEFFFFGADDFESANYQNNKKNVLLFQGSFIPNGITTSYLNLAEHIDVDANNVYLAVDPVAVMSDPRRIEKFGQNPDHVHVLARVGLQLVTAEERWVIDKFNAQSDLVSEEQWSIYHRAFKREFRRMFGYAHFDSVVCFEGYARFWAALFANTTNPEALRTIYLHNDMQKEWRNRFKYLEANFRLYRSFDSLVSVTESVSEENTNQLAEAFGIPVDRFTFCNNLVNAESTLQLASEELDPEISDWAAESSALFVTLGRLSPEKGHEKLIRAFADIVVTHPNSKLAILGDGPLRETLDLLVEELSLQSNVMLAGLRLNPFAILRRADCFVFSSDYEGQGLVVLEALILGRPVISTNVVGPRSVLEGGYGLLVDNSVTGLLEGMYQFLTSEIPHRTFDYEEYQREAVSKFKQVALGTS